MNSQPDAITQRKDYKHKIKTTAKSIEARVKQKISSEQSSANVSKEKIGKISLARYRIEVFIDDVIFCILNNPDNDLDTLLQDDYLHDKAFAHYVWNHKNDFINQILLDYLYIWLQDDPNARQGVYYFTQYNYATQSERKKLKKDGKLNSPDDGKRKRFSSITEDLKDNFKQQNSQARSEKASFKQPPKDDLNFIQWRFVDAVEKGYLSLYDLLLLDKVGLPDSNNDRILDGYRQYDRMLHDIKREANDRKFTIYCMQYYSFENTYLFAFIARLTKFMKGAGISPQEPLPKFFKFAMQRFHGNQSSCSPFFRDFDTNFKIIYDKNIRFDIDNPVLLNRCLISDIIQIYIDMFPVSKLDPWTENDFREAAEFLRDEDGYNINKALEPLEIDLSHCEYIKHLFNNDTFVVNISFEDARRVLQEKRRARKKEKKQSESGEKQEEQPQAEGCQTPEAPIVIN